MKLVSFVIPCYRSAHTITGVTEELAAAMAGLAGCDYEIVLVNDCSPDNTWDVIRALAENDAHIVAVDLAKNFGQHAAIMAGLRHTAGEIVVCLDDDGQTPGDEAGKLIRKLEEGYDVVYAEYAHKQHSAFRNFGTVVNNRMTEIMLGKPRELTITSYFAMRRFIVDEMLIYKNCYPYVEGLILRATRKIGTVPVTHRAREEGESGYNLDLVRRHCGAFGLYLLYRHPHQALCGQLHPRGLGLHHGADAAAGRDHPAGAGHDRGVYRPHLHVHQRLAPVCGAAGDPEEGLSG